VLSYAIHEWEVIRDWTRTSVVNIPLQAWLL
jgi:hypothetical protein